MNADTIAGRIWAKLHYDEYLDCMSKVKPTLRNPRYVKMIWDEVNALDAEFEKKRDLFVAAVYQAYAPASYVSEGVAKLPPGVRDEVATVLSFVNANLASHYKKQWAPAMNPFNNGPERPFRAAVMAVVEKFKKFSINTDEIQYRMRFE